VDSVGTLGRLAADEITSALATNLAAPVALANLFCRIFTDADLARRVINISFGSGRNRPAGEAVYCVAKAGMEMLTRALATEQQAPTFRAVTVRLGNGHRNADLRPLAAGLMSCQSRTIQGLSARRAPRCAGSRGVEDHHPARHRDIDHGRTYVYQEL